MEVFLPNEENSRPGLLFFNFDDVRDIPFADSADEILLLSLNYTYSLDFMIYNGKKQKTYFR